MEGQQVNDESQQEEGRKSECKRMKRKPKTKKRETYNVYLRKVLRQVHPNSGISKAAMTICNDLMNDLFGKFTHEMAKLVRLAKRATLTARDVQTAVRLVVRGELAQHAVQEGVKAVTKFSRTDAP